MRIIIALLLIIIFITACAPQEPIAGQAIGQPLSYEACLDRCTSVSDLAVQRVCEEKCENHK